MREIISFLNDNGFWVMIVAIVAIGSWFKYRRYELRLQQEMRVRELEHQQKMKELEVEQEKAKAKQTAEKV